MSFLKAKYYDHPDGEDAFGKMVATNKYAAATGLAWSTVDVLMVSKPRGYLPTLARFAYNTGPMMGMATAFTLGTYIATNVRGKDDRLNYFLGGLAAGGVYGSWRHSVVAGCVMGLFFGIAGTVKKLSIQENWEFFPKPIGITHGGLNLVQNDWTIMADRPKNYDVVFDEPEKPTTEKKC